jgi:hypothetical protein
VVGKKLASSARTIVFRKPDFAEKKPIYPSIQTCIQFVPLKKVYSQPGSLKVPIRVLQRFTVVAL